MLEVLTTSFDSHFRSSHLHFGRHYLIYLFLFGVGLGERGGGGWGVSSLPIVTHVHCTWGICTVSLSVSYLFEANGWVWFAFQQFVVLSPAVKVFGFREHIGFEESQIWRRGWFCFPLLLWCWCWSIWTILHSMRNVIEKIDCRTFPKSGGKVQKYEEDRQITQETLYL